MKETRRDYIVERIKVLKAEIARLERELLDAGIVLTEPEKPRAPWNLTGRRDSPSHDNENTIPEHFD